MEKKIEANKSVLIASNVHQGQPPSSVPRYTGPLSTVLPSAVLAPNPCNDPQLCAYTSPFIEASYCELLITSKVLSQRAISALNTIKSAFHYSYAISLTMTTLNKTAFSRALAKRTARYECRASPIISRTHIRHLTQPSAHAIRSTRALPPPDC